jgi:hypothetical protein
VKLLPFTNYEWPLTQRTLQFDGAFVQSEIDLFLGWIPSEIEVGTHYMDLEGPRNE